MKPFPPLCLGICLCLLGLVTVPSRGVEPENPAGTKDHTTSPHSEALALVFKTQQKVIAEVDTGNWWHDVKERQWIVVRPFQPGAFDSTHLFVVTYRIDEKAAASWSVDTRKKTVTPRKTGDKAADDRE